MLLRVLIVLGITGLPSLGVAQEAAKKPNIVFILADDLGIHDLGCYGRTEHNTPNLDRLARQGLRFTSAYCAQPICSPSRAAIMTGLAPARLHITTFLPGRPNCPSQKVLHPDIQQQLNLEHTTLAKYLRVAGYATACVGKWHLGGKGFSPTDHGFDHYFPSKGATQPSDTEGGKGEYALTAAAEDFMAKNKDRPFFVYLCHDNPHINYSAKKQFLDKNAKAIEPVYAAVIETLDDVVGRLLAKIDELGIADNTIVIFTSDNGGVHMPEGQHTRITHNGRFRAGKGYLYEGGVRIPLIVRWPGRFAADKTIDAPMINTDWTPTLMELVGAPVSKKLDGVSVASLLLGKAPPPERMFYWHFPHYNNQGGRPSGALRDRDWKFVEFYDDDQVELYDLANDLSESANLAQKHPERVARYRKSLADWRVSIGAQSNSPNPSFDATLYRKLYVDFDASRYNMSTATAEQFEQVQAWRRGMNQVVPKAKAKNK